MIYYIVDTGTPADTPWRVASPDGLLEIIKSDSAPASFEQQITADEARALAAEWAPDMEPDDE